MNIQKQSDTKYLIDETTLEISSIRLNSISNEETKIGFFIEVEAPELKKIPYFTIYNSLSEAQEVLEAYIKELQQGYNPSIKDFEEVYKQLIDLRINESSNATPETPAPEPTTDNQPVTDNDIHS
ncbi:hypothetical protein F4X90_22470 [Candidatus Poribacteria bacterium]|nr:hypothetical protein [Candidatus Poribacteria bacterium]